MQKKIKSEKLKVKSFLEEIMKLKKEELSRKTQKNSTSGSQRVRKSESKFLKVLCNESGKLKLIAEIKIASPTNSHLGIPEELLERSKQYERAGADVISVITEKHFFKGDLAFVPKIKKLVSLPVLQKDFVIDMRQIYEAKTIGSDALLLIARLVDNEKLKQFVELCFQVGVEPVVEINNEEDLKKAIESKTRIIAVNARDLETFEISVQRACLVMKQIPNNFIILGFSGIHSAKEVAQYKEAGSGGVLIGTSLMQANNIAVMIQSLQL